VLRDLLSWAADLAIVLTRDCPEDQIAIERVHNYALACLAGARCPDPELSLDDMLTTAAALMSGIDRNLRDEVQPDAELDEDARAVGAPVAS
jgi:hypothetical protein